MLVVNSAYPLILENNQFSSFGKRDFTCFNIMSERTLNPHSFSESNLIAENREINIEYVMRFVIYTNYLMMFRKQLGQLFSPFIYLLKYLFGSTIQTKVETYFM